MITRKCNKCGLEHEVFYTRYKDSTKHLMMICGKSYVYIPFEDNLDIKEHLTKSLIMKI